MHIGKEDTIMSDVYEASVESIIKRYSGGMYDCGKDSDDTRFKLLEQDLIWHIFGVLDNIKEKHKGLLIDSIRSNIISVVGAAIAGSYCNAWMYFDDGQIEKLSSVIMEELDKLL
jgi:hypothetical protein